MGQGAGKQSDAFAFLTVMGTAEDGLFGGMLVLNRHGRPLEFHCTAPVKPNRAQQILYGPTLAPYLYGEQIGVTLLSKATQKIKLVFVDERDCLAMRPLVDLPVAAVLPRFANRKEATKGEGDRPLLESTTPREYRGMELFQVGDSQLALSLEFSPDRGAIEQACSDELDLTEPFERIREAIAEAQRAA